MSNLDLSKFKDITDKIINKDYGDIDYDEMASDLNEYGDKNLTIIFKCLILISNILFELLIKLRAINPSNEISRKTEEFLMNSSSDKEDYALELLHMIYDQANQIPRGKSQRDYKYWLYVIVICNQIKRLLEYLSKNELYDDFIIQLRPIMMHMVNTSKDLAEQDSSTQADNKPKQDSEQTSSTQADNKPKQDSEQTSSTQADSEVKQNLVEQMKHDLGQIYQYLEWINRYPGQMNQYLGQIYQYLGQIKQCLGQINYSGQMNQYLGQIYHCFEWINRYPGQMNQYIGWIYYYLEQVRHDLG